LLGLDFQPQQQLLFFAFESVYMRSFSASWRARENPALSNSLYASVPRLGAVLIVS
jgi:hypothetical protein